jgi:hypothetical protein
MATGGVFQIITNDGKQDRMLMATALLNRRLALIEEARSKDPLVSDSTPTLLDIEKTHILFMNAHFKPFAAIGYEYNKVNPQSSTSSLGGEVQFSIPQFGDFFGDMVVHATVTAPTFLKGGNTIKPSGRWCTYPGLRLFQLVKFDVNGNPLDEYTCDATAMYNQVCVQPNKRDAWDRCVGQEKPLSGYLPQKDDAYDFTGILPSHRVKMEVCNGYQTPKPSGSVSNLDVWVPLLFWFNKDPRLVIPSVSIPHGQRYITLKLATNDQMFQLDANGNNTAPTYVTNPAISKMEMYINNIFVNPEVHDIFIKRIGFSLIRVHRESNTSLKNSTDEILLNKMKWPIETMYVGFRRTSYQTSAASNDKWHTFHGYSGTNTYLIHGVAGWDGAAVDDPAAISADTPLRMTSNISVSAHGIPLYNSIDTQFYDSYVPLMYGGQNINAPATAGILMINFCIYPGTYQPSSHVNVSRAREFYLKYVGGLAEDGSTQLISSTNPAQLVIVASAINFLLITDGNQCRCVLVTECKFVLV